MTEKEKKEYEELKRKCLHFEQEFRRLQYNPVYFLEKYYNKLEDPIETNDKDKQAIFDKFNKGVAPYFDDFNEAMKFTDKKKSLEEKGHKDWEVHDILFSGE
ncbi:MAG: hypothetical protein N4A49_08070 [Marinifilaceae bacterium]|nr:hypothetical protein [Marinifilaceae bacterium]